MTSNKIQRIKQELACAFSEGRQTKAWHIWVNRITMACLIINAITIFLSTYDILQREMGQVLHYADLFTTMVFLVEVSLRIWVADLQDTRFKGILGRVRYCLTPYGFIDAVSTYPSVLMCFTSLSPVVFKSLRVLRLLRIFRFMRAFRLLGNAIAHKREELLLSLGSLAVVTFMFSLVMYYVEHAANPSRYANGMETMVWAFMQYIGDPGGFAGNAPETFVGRVVSCFIGVLGIAVFAVPAGLIGSGFIEEVEQMKKKKDNMANADSIRRSFQRVRCRYTLFQAVPINHTIPQMQVNTRLSIEEILDAIDSADDLRLVNLARSVNVEDKPVDQLAVEHFLLNRPYGCCINRHSKVTIVETSSYMECGMGNFAYYLARIGGFNYLSREIGVAPPPYKSYYTFTDETVDPYLPLFMADLNSMAYAEDHFVFYVLAASGGQEPKLPTEIHFNYGGKKGDETYNDPNRTLHRTEQFEAFFQDVTKALRENLDYGTDKQRYYDTSAPNNIMRKLKHADKVNSITLRMKWGAVVSDLRRTLLAKTLADACCRHFEADREHTYDPVLSMPGIGYEEDNI